MGWRDIVLLFISAIATISTGFGAYVYNDISDRITINDKARKTVETNIAEIQSDIKVLTNAQVNQEKLLDERRSSRDKDIELIRYDIAEIKRLLR